MFTDLTDHVDRFKREVAPLGQFESLNPEVFDSDVVWALADAFGEAQMMGMFPAHTLEGADVSPALSPREVSVVVAFAGARHLRNQLFEAETRSKYEAGPVLYEVERSAALLRDLLKATLDKLKRVVDDDVASRRVLNEVYVIDAYALRSAGLP